METSEECRPLLNSENSSCHEPKEVYRSRWLSIRIMYLSCFIGSVAFTICVASVWPYLQTMDKDSNESFLGWVVAAFSLGQLVASPCFGFLYNFQGRARPSLLISSTIAVVGYLLYAYIYLFPVPRRVFLLISRVVIGFGFGNMSVIRSYVSAASTVGERTGVMATISGVQAIGFILGPSLQVVLTPLGYPSVLDSNYFFFNIYTAPAWLGVLSILINIALLLFIFEEHRLDGNSVQKAARYLEDDGNINKDVKTNNKVLTHKPVDRIAALVCVAFFFVVLFVFSIFETLGTPLTMAEYGWSQTQATFYNGIIMAVMGVISIGVFLGVKIMAARLNERIALLFGFFIMLVGYFVQLPWGSVHPPLRWININASAEAWKFTNSTPPTVGVGGGCPSDYKWCLNTPQVSMPQLFIGYVLVTVGYPLANIMTYTLFSKILGPIPLGVWMGLLTGVGSGARCLAPVYVSNIYVYFGPRVVFASVSGILFCMCLVVLAAYRRLVPYNTSLLNSQSEN